ncbi:hypothetical protein SCHPADRAFT_940000 [Schizopora paradoxa]|uniref:Uncharacterized protein n=1 Tax=Schizopora paradoxa TaxID=27342 RepID=A0A0H2RWT3_9AGAM|nr:hypothetical protein SCHPADRAFT_940000 [Schizopora paradoxa]
MSYSTPLRSAAPLPGPRIFRIDTTDTCSSISTTATAPNLPGPGRNVGLIFDFLGASLERFMIRRASMRLRLRAEAVVSTSSVSTTATAPNLSGAGRTVGLLFDFLGITLERFMNRQAATRLRLGPDAVVQDIRALRRLWPYSESFVDAHPPTLDEQRRLAKLCKKLLKYCSATVLETQLCALNELTALAFDDPYLRRLLSDFPTKRYLSPAFREPELHVASAKAMICIEEVEVHTLFKTLQKLWMRKIALGPRGMIDQFSWTKGAQRCEQRIGELICDPDRSFMVVRHMRTSHVSPIPKIWNQFLKFAYANPDLVEWDGIELDILRMEMEMARGVMGSRSFNFSRFVVEEPFRFRQFIQSSLTLSSTTSIGSQHDAERTFYMLSRLSGSTGLSDHIMLARQIGKAIQHQSEHRDMLEPIERSMLTNEMWIAFSHLVVYHLPTSRFFGSDWIPRKRCPKKDLRPACAFLADYYLDTSLHEYSDTREYSVRLIASALTLSRYCKLVLESLLSNLLPSDCREDVLQPSSLIYRIRQDDEIISTLPNQPSTSESTFCAKRYHHLQLAHSSDLECSLFSERGYDDVFFLEVYGHSSPFDATGHYPILAGFNSEDESEELYTAIVFYDDADDGDAVLSKKCLVHVGDGARVVSYVDGKGNQRKTDRFFVMVLRYDPSDREYRHRDIPSSAVFQTGPAYWLEARRTVVDGAKDNSNICEDESEDVDVEENRDEVRCDDEVFEEEERPSAESSSYQTLEEVQEIYEEAVRRYNQLALQMREVEGRMEELSESFCDIGLVREAEGDYEGEH